jgi:hypothetical protein
MDSLIFKLPSNIEYNRRFLFDVNKNIQFGLGQGIAYIYEDKSLFGINIGVSLNIDFKEHYFLGVDARYQFVQLADYDANNYRTYIKLGKYF